MFFISLTWSSYQAMLYIWMGLAVVVFLLLLKVTAPYGRHTSSKWGALVSNKWGWFIMELPALLVLWYLLSKNFSVLNIVSWMMLTLFSLHYVNRIFVFPFRLNTKKKKLPLIIVMSAVLFNLFNGFSFGYYFNHFSYYSTRWLTDFRFIGGTLIFLAGIYINWKADNRLIHLRKPGETGYKIPQGWLFEKISCPNLFGELIEWLGFAILCWNIPALAFFTWTAANLIPRALAHHRWYKENFSDYPDERKAIFPGLL